MAQVVKEGKSLLPFQKRSREEVIASLKEDGSAWQGFLRLTDQLQEELLGFAMGERGVKISYDPFFKKIFDPEEHGGRLSRMLSQILGFEVQVKRGLSQESQRIAAEGSLLSMDVLAELLSGELANVEIQKIGYTFPGERAACYSSDLMMRQYTRVKAQKKQAFSYQDIQNVYTIVLIEKSTPEFQKLPDCYLHRSQDGFNTGLELNLPQKFIFIPLDVFYKIAYTVDKSIASELVAWLLFLSSDKLEDMVRIIDCYPEFGELYQEMAEFQRKPEELVGMYSEALAIMDRNTVQYMIEEQKKELEKLKVESEELKLETEELKLQSEELKLESEELKLESEELKLESEELKLETERRCQEKDLEIQRLRQLLNQTM